MPLLLLVCWVNRVDAVAIYPETIDVAVEPSSATSVKVFLGNQGEDLSTLFLTMRIVTFSPDDGTPVFLDSAYPWASLDKTELTLGLNETAEVTLTVAPTKEIVPDVYALALLAQEDPTSTGGMKFSPAYAALVFVTVGDVTEPREVCEALSIQQTDRSLLVTSTFTNDGGGILYVGTSTDIFSLLGTRTIDDSSAEFHRVLSHQTRTLEWQTEIPWWMFGPINVGLHTSGCDKQSMIVYPSKSVFVAAIVMIGIPGVAYWLWLRRRK